MLRAFLSHLRRARPRPDHAENTSIIFSDFEKQLLWQIVVSVAPRFYRTLQ
jgi:hypothetical protein